MKALKLIFLSVLFVGCSTTSNIVPIGKDTFLISKEQTTGFQGLGTMKADIIGEANKYCSSQGKVMEIVSTSDSQPPFILGNYPRSEINFMCLSTNDSEHVRPRLTKSPDKTITIINK